MIRTQVYIPEDQYNELKLLTAMGYGTFSELFREGLDIVIKKRRKTGVKTKNDLGVWKDFVGMLKGGPKTDAVKVINDYYLNDVV